MRAKWNLTVPDDEAELLAELRSHGVRPGLRLHVEASDQESEESAQTGKTLPSGRKSAMGCLTDKFPPEGVDELIRGLDEGKADRLEAVGLS